MNAKKTIDEVLNGNHSNEATRTAGSVLALAVLLLAGFGAWPGHAQTAPERDERILLRAAVFDPLKQPAYLAEQMAPPPAAVSERRIVQFHQPLTREQRQMLQSEYGLKLTRYVPNHAYIERVPDDAMKRLEQLELVRATVPYQPGFRIAPEMGTLVFRSEARQMAPGLFLRAFLFDDVDPHEVAASLGRIPGVSDVDVRDHRAVGASARIDFRVASKDVAVDVAQLDGLVWVEEVAEQDEDNGRTAGTIQSGTTGIVPIWDQGIHGERQVVGVIEGSRLDIDHCMFEDPANNTPGPGHRKVLGLGTGSAGDHATFVAGIVAGDNFNNPGAGPNRGNAWAARLTANRASPSVIDALVANQADGATLHTNSWHDNTNGIGNPALYNGTAAEVDAFTWSNEDHLVFGSMGNNGEEQGPPGTAKNAVGVNASQFDPNENIVGDGNPGPTADGRRKPDLVTPGCTITSAENGTACTITLDQNVYPWITPPICATSWATPAAAAAAALVRQYYTDGFYPSGTAQAQHGFTPPGALIKATLLNATLDMTGPPGYPSNNEGWGMVRLQNTLAFPSSPRKLRAWHERNSTGLATGESVAFPLSVDSSAEPLKVTLVWTEPPGTAGAVNPVINNLDLTVVSPGGSTFRGNVFAAGQSTTGGAADAINNVEQVLINAPAVGTWTLQVSAPAVNVGQPGQGYALVATGGIIPGPQLQVPGALHFGDGCAGATSFTELDVCNTGKGDLIVDPITSSDPQFAVTTPSAGYPVVISPDFCFPFQVRFGPTASGPQSAVLTIPSNDPASPSTNVQAFGTGAEPDIRVTGSTGFGVTSAWRPAERVLSVCNTGGCDLSVAPPAVGCTDFALVSDPFPATLGAGSCVDLVVGFTPDLPGAKSCGLSIPSNDPDTPVVNRTLTARTPPFFSLQAGLASPHGALNAVARQGSTFDLGYVHPLGPKWAWDVELGFSSFDGRAGLPDVDLSRISANARFTVNPGAPARFFLNGGLGLYHFDPGTFEGGGNLGIGVEVPVGARFVFAAGYEYHLAFTASPDLEFDQLQAGFLVSF